MGTLTPGTPSTTVSRSRIALPFVAVLALILALLPRVDARGEGEVVEEATATEAVVEEEAPPDTTTTTAAPAETTTTTAAPAETTTTTAAPAETTTTTAAPVETTTTTAAPVETTTTTAAPVETTTTTTVPALVPVLWTTTADGTPKYDFAPGETVYIHGADFPAEMLLDIVVTRPDGTIVTGDGSFSCTNCWDSVMTGAGGGFVYAYVLNGIEGLYSMAAYASPWSGEAALATGTFHDSPPVQIRSDTHEGEKKDLTTNSSAGWTTGNTTEFQEGDWVNFRFHLTADDAAIGQMAVHFSIEGAGCDFFEPAWTIGHKDYGSGAVGATIVADSGTTATLTATTNGAYALSSEWIQNLDLVSTGAGGWTVYYHLYLTDNVDGCTGSSQHSRLAAGSNPGAYTQTGQKNVPVPANAVIRYPDITVIKQIDRDGDGTYESLATAGEYQFDLSPDPTSIDSGEPLTTNGGGSVFFENIAPDGSYSILESQLIIGADGVHEFVGLAPTGNENCAIVGGLVTAAVEAGDAGDVKHATCIVQNRARTGTLEVVKDLVPATDSGTFDLSIDGTAYATGVGDGGTTGVQTVYQGSHTIAEAGAGGTLLTDYASSVTCVDAAGAPIATTGSGPWDVDVLDGQAITCTITNIRTSSITIVKDATGLNAAGAEFDYTTTGLTPSAFTLGDSESRVFDGLVPGTYSVVEGDESGWYLDDLTCTGGANVTPDVTTGTVTVNLAAGEDVVCTYENVEYGSIKIVKDATGVNAAGTLFDYTSTSFGAFGLGAGGWMTFTDLVPGSYSVTESTEPGWYLDNLTCTGGANVTPDVTTSTATVNLAAGEDVVCTYENIEYGSIKIVKDAIGVNAAGAEFDYEATGLNPSPFTLGDGNAVTFLGLTPGEYSVTEKTEPGWYLNNLTCTGGANAVPDATTGTATVKLAAGEDVVCTYENIEYGSIRIVKDATGLASASATFAYTSGKLGSFSLGDGENEYFGALKPGAYSVTEALVLGEPWTLTAITCTGGSNVATDTGTATATVTLAAGEDVVCTFSNREQGTITIVKQTLPDGDAATFPFDASYQTASILLGDGQSDTSAMLEPGTYTVAETVPAGWDLITITCEDTATAATIDMDAASASIPLAAGEHAVCTFTNQKRGSITIVKEDASAFDNPGDGDDFAFGGDLGAFTLDDPDVDDGDAFGDTFVAADLVTGTYTVTETLVPDGDPLDLDGPWSLESIVCSGADVSVSGSSVDITLDPGEDATCTFSNEQEEIILPPYALGDFVWEDDNDNGLQDAGETGIAGVTVQLLDADTSTVLATTLTNASGLYSFWITEPGTYVVKFTTPASYDITDGLVGSNTAIDSNLLPTGLTPEIEVTVAKMLGIGSDLTIDAGFVFIEPPDIIETGADTEQMAGLAGALLLGGFLLLLLSRRRRAES